MSIRTWLKLGAISLLLPAISFAQPPAGGSGGFQGGGRGGRGMLLGDPDQLFDRFSGGKDVIVRDASNPMMQMMFDRIAQGAGITNGQITREQFKAAMSQYQAAISAGGGMGGFGMGGRGGRQSVGVPSQGGGNGGMQFAPGGGMPGGMNWRGAGDQSTNEADWELRAESRFRRMDKDNDGLLNDSEMGEALAAERDKWDTNQDGFIDLTEYKAYFNALAKQRTGESKKDSDQASSDQDDDQPRRPVVYRAGKLPQELTPWFAQLDTNQDAQISMAEWRASGRPLTAFRAMDHNGDNLVTVEEALLYMRLNKLTAANVLTAGVSNNYGDSDQDAADRPALGFTAPGEFTGGSSAVAANDRGSQGNGSQGMDGGMGMPMMGRGNGFQGRGAGRSDGGMVMGMGMGATGFGGPGGGRQNWQGGGGFQGNGRGSGGDSAGGGPGGRRNGQGRGGQPGGFGGGRGGFGGGDVSGGDTSGSQRVGRGGYGGGPGGGGDGTGDASGYSRGGRQRGGNRNGGD